LSPDIKYAVAENRKVLSYQVVVAESIFTATLKDTVEKIGSLLFPTDTVNELLA